MKYDQIWSSLPRHLTGTQECGMKQLKHRRTFLQLIIDAKERAHASFSPYVDYERIHFEQENNRLASIRNPVNNGINNQPRCV